MMDNLETRLIVDINDLRTFHPALARGIINEPIVYIPRFEAAAKEVRSKFIAFVHETNGLYYIGVIAGCQKSIPQLL